MKIILQLSIISIIILSSCTPIKVVSDHDDHLDFTQYSTYQLDLNKSVFPEDANPIQHERLEKEIKIKMKELGFQESSNPDLNLRYFVNKVTHETVINKGTEPESIPYKYNFEIYQYKEGSLVIDFYDAKDNSALWHGILSRSVDEDLKTAEKRIQRNVKAMFNRFAHETGINKINNSKI